MVRVNGVESGEISHDLKAVFMGGADDNKPDALMLPKCENVEHLEQVCYHGYCNMFVLFKFSLTFLLDIIGVHFPSHASLFI